MKNKKLLLNISIIIISVLILSIIILVILGKQERKGYLSDLKLNIDKTLEINGLDINESRKLFTIENKLNRDGITNYIFTNKSITNYSYDFRIRCYSKVFRDTDIYGIYLNLNNLPEYIKSARMNDNLGEPLGNFISDKQFAYDEEINNISYTLKVKIDIYIYVILIILFCIVCYINILNPNIINKVFNKKIITSIFFVLILVLITYYVIFLKLNYNNFPDSDASSELILSNLLSKEHSILSSNWYYSTELRVLNTQLIFSPLFYLFESWNNVRVVGATLLLIIMLISGIFLCKQLRLEKVYIALFAIIILTPFSNEYFIIVMSKSFYIPHIFISFITFGLILLTARIRNNFKYKTYFIILNSILCIIGVLAGMGGLRQLLILYIPLFISSAYLFCIEKGIFFQNNKIIHIDTNKFRYFYIVFIETILILSASLIGYIINNGYFRKIYHFASHNEIRFTSFSLERFVNVINGYLTSIGFQPGTKIFSISLLPNFICFITICLLIISIIDILKNKIYSNEEKLLTLFFVAASIVFCGLYSFSDMFHTERYNIPIVIFAYLIIIIFIKHKILMLKTKNYYNFFASGFLLLFILSGLLIYFNPSYTTKNELVNVSNTLKDYGCHYGYATFWNGNVLTELSDGALEIYHWGDSYAINTSDKINEISHWLQLVKHSSEIPSGKIFCIFSGNELGSPIANSMEGADILYKTERYTVYIFQSYDSMISKVNTYFSNN